ncbi:hypothetical protein CLOACE_16470 [Clostridium acetireducens DSM 10703]|uniref:DUF7922 domain-containing protein n=1 Tax=Clostridium acetireducens DSM 10703 TaxID=1121290 RepID=A0A1E8EXT8_9CLOT|nr:hypothetical protein [Clostridium acetireducens]OFI05489.1 hypothetical protein CLOACE_16470 [Clostridium acetireducens DSM 10703]
MAQKKNYSRYFIILQENEKGYGIEKDKSPTGYVKLEVKGEKCKVSYYVQNLKRENSPYYIILICGKKNENKLIKVGEVNIDDYGRSDISNEYNSNNLANTGLSVDKVSGAAIIKLLDSNIIPIMSGFTSTNIPNWKEYKIIEDKTRDYKDHYTSENKEKSKSKEEKSIFDKYEQSIEKVKEKAKEKVKEEAKEEAKERAKEKVREEVKEEAKEKAKEEIKEEVKEEAKEKAKEEVKEEAKEKAKEEVKEEAKEKAKEKVREEVKEEAKEKAKEKAKEEAREEVKEEINEETKEKIRKELREELKNEIREEIKQEILLESKQNNDKYKTNNEFVKNHYELEQNINSVDNCMLVDDTIVNDFDSNRGHIFNEHIKDVKEPVKITNNFFKKLLKEFEPLKNFCPDIKRCYWYKIPVRDFKDMYNVSNILLYYPILNHYSYINKYYHYILGYKLDEIGHIKYIVYGIPGTKKEKDQPYKGKSGFVTWVPLNDKSDTGYWLMFYDFKNSTILIPIK